MNRLLILMFGKGTRSVQVINLSANMIWFILLTLPSAAPTPIATLEVQTWDGGNVYIDAGARTVQCNGSSANRRYISDLVGFFQ